MKKVKAILFASTLATTTILGYNATASQDLDWVMQNKQATPGALNKDVTQANIATTVCKSGWTATIRPTVTYTNKLKADQLKTTYSGWAMVWGNDPSKYEEDHLISLQLGGDPKDPKNLWPQPYSTNGARKKDVVETALKRLVCSGKMKLADAQKAILNWPDAYKKYVTSKDTADTSDN